MKNNKYTTNQQQKPKESEQHKISDFADSKTSEQRQVNLAYI